MKQFSLFFLLLLVTFSCSKNTSEEETEAVVVTDDFKSYRLDGDQPQERFADLIESVEVVRLEETDNSLLAYVRNLQQTKDYLVFNSSTMESDVFVFDRNGAFVNKINRQGDGPEEYQAVSNIWMESDTLAVYTSSKKTVKRYSLEGDFISTVTLPVAGAHVHGYNGAYAMEMNYSPINDTSYYRYASLGKDLQLSGMYLPVDNKMDMWMSLSMNPISPYKDGVTLLRMMSDTVYRLSDNQFTPFIHFDFGQDWYWNESRDLLQAFGGAMQTTDKLWSVHAQISIKAIWVYTFSGVSQEKAPPSYLIDRATGQIRSVDMRTKDKPKGVAVAMDWDDDRLIFTVQSPDMRSFLSELNEDQIKFRQGTTLEEIESSENPVLMWVKFKRE
ncbi:6-bladed beta-propeller protein [Roseivirga ehrenbergii]|uniref:6-bladed beta-propeller n=1 Tax=Roseivirga ehrenbergii (strain DSM 102268 / JCM 13514 / KCTC 12282 / NCIMB 14502 / KMM 6017) TaxID=279360 RepID=A0A150XPP7_ROSEK|nr:6-bladed beta-propeller [Roseivirga ehrenbergii]KYG80625.1 hypothetical protein MB14_15875 [Roseivirga ehrenbergii]TCL07872.1 6-bladed beta-propeller protein [Roseivirga ehrenbergii]